MVCACRTRVDIPHIEVLDFSPFLYYCSEYIPHARLVSSFPPSVASENLILFLRGNETMKKILAIALLIACSCFLLIRETSAEEFTPAAGPDVNAPQPASAPTPQAAGLDIAVISRSTITELTAGENLRYYRSLDDWLMRSIVTDLEDRGLRVDFAETEDSLKKKEYRHLLAYKVEDVEFGFKNPFGRHANVRVSYVFQKPDGRVLASGEYREHSNKSWKKCAISISRKVSTDVANVLSGNHPAKAGNAGTPDKTVEERLKELDSLKAKGLVTKDEYRSKREEILKDL